MEDKTNVIKCMSSNYAKTSRSEYRNKKSRSNAEFPPYVMKKRGVYVEKKVTKPRITKQEKNYTQERKAPPRPPPGNKKFLASVLTILSKSTTGTQYPDHDPVPQKKERTRIVRHNPKMDNVLDVIQANVKSKSKYRSKALNNEVAKEVNQEQVVVLQSQKDIIQTPSIYSENDSFNWSNLPVLVKRTQQSHSKQEDIGVKVKEVADELAKEIMEGRKPRKDKRVRIDEPNTQVSDITPITNNEAGNGKGLYNFFVDLLETTMSVYNIKTHYDKSPDAPSEGSSTKIPLEINESVAEKLNVQNKLENELTVQHSNHFYCLKELEYGNYPKAEKELQLKSTKKKKCKGDSISFTRKAGKKLQADNMIETKKSFSRKARKKTLINMFKEQLQMDENAFEEPQNLYQALKVIAQNKRMCQKSIHFEEAMKRKRKDYDFPECMFRRRKVISPRTKSTNKRNKKMVDTSSISRRQSQISSYRRKPRTEEAMDNEFKDSYRSLEVFGYDYETQSVKSQAGHIKKELLFTYHSTPTSSDHSFGCKDVLGLSDSDSMYFIN